MRTIQIILRLIDDPVGHLDKDEVDDVAGGAGGQDVDQGCSHNAAGDPKNQIYQNSLRHPPLPLWHTMTHHRLTNCRSFLYSLFPHHPCLVAAKFFLTKHQSIKVKKHIRPIHNLSSKAVYSEFIKYPIFYEVPFNFPVYSFLAQVLLPVSDGVELPHSHLLHTWGLSPWPSSGSSQPTSPLWHSSITVVGRPTRYSLLFIFGFLFWSSSWCLQPHKGVPYLVWPLLRAGMVVLDHFFSKCIFYTYDGAKMKNTAKLYGDALV